MSKAWDLSCTCTNGEICLWCRRYPDTPSGRLKREIDRSWERQQTQKKNKQTDEYKAVVGYHIAAIERGEYGESSKILEEVRELQDAESQGARIMILHELSDILGAVHGYLRKHFPDIKFEDLVKMADLTRRAFESGNRK